MTAKLHTILSRHQIGINNHNTHGLDPLMRKLNLFITIINRIYVSATVVYESICIINEYSNNENLPSACPCCVYCCSTRTKTSPLQHKLNKTVVNTVYY